MPGDEFGTDGKSVFTAGDLGGKRPTQGGGQPAPSERHLMLTRGEKLAYLIVSALVCLCVGALYYCRPWRMAWGLAGGPWPLAASLAVWLAIAATYPRAGNRMEPGLLILQFLCAVTLAPLHGVSLPAGLLLACLAVFRAFVRLPLGDSGAALGAASLLIMGFFLTRLGMDGGRGGEEFVLFMAMSVFGIWLALINRWHLEHRLGSTAALRRVQAVTSELFDANVYLQDRVDQAFGEAARQERLSLARELHDTVAYAFTTIAAAIETGTELIGSDPEMAVRELHHARSLTTEGLREVRGVVRMLREKAERGFRGPERWTALANVFHEATGVIVTLDIPAKFPQIVSELDEVIYRLVQEGMINAFRHGRATVIWVRVWMERGHLCVLISDNGCGAKEVGGGFGLLGMQERVHALGGRLSWRSAPGAGFDLAVEIPFTERRAGPDDQGAFG